MGQIISHNNNPDHLYGEIVNGMCRMQSEYTILPLIPLVSVENMLRSSTALSSCTYLPALSPLSHDHFINYSGILITVLYNNSLL